MEESSRPENPTPQKMKRTKLGRYTSEICKEELESLFHLPSEQACKELRIGLTMLKRICRRFGIERWPYNRKLGTAGKPPAPSARAPPASLQQADMTKAQADGTKAQPAPKRGHKRKAKPAEDLQEEAATDERAAGEQAAAPRPVRAARLKAGNYADGSEGSDAEEGSEWRGSQEGASAQQSGGGSGSSSRGDSRSSSRCPASAERHVAKPGALAAAPATSRSQLGAGRTPAQLARGKPAQQEQLEEGRCGPSADPTPAAAALKVLAASTAAASGKVSAAQLPSTSHQRLRQPESQCTAFPSSSGQQAGQAQHSVAPAGASLCLPGPHLEQLSSEDFTSLCVMMDPCAAPSEGGGSTRQRPWGPSLLGRARPPTVPLASPAPPPLSPASTLDAAHSMVDDALVAAAAAAAGVTLLEPLPAGGPSCRSASLPPVNPFSQAPAGLLGAQAPQPPTALLLDSNLLFQEAPEDTQYPGAAGLWSTQHSVTHKTAAVAPTHNVQRSVSLPAANPFSGASIWQQMAEARRLRARNAGSCPSSPATTLFPPPAVAHGGSIEAGGAGGELLDVTATFPLMPAPRGLEDEQPLLSILDNQPAWAVPACHSSAGSALDGFEGSVSASVAGGMSSFGLLPSSMDLTMAGQEAAPQPPVEPPQASQQRDRLTLAKVHKLALEYASDSSNPLKASLAQRVLQHLHNRGVLEQRPRIGEPCRSVGIERGAAHGADSLLSPFHQAAAAPPPPPQCPPCLGPTPSEMQLWRHKSAPGLVSGSVEMVDAPLLGSGLTSAAGLPLLPAQRLPAQLYAGSGLGPTGTGADLSELLQSWAADDVMLPQLPSSMELLCGGVDAGAAHLSALPPAPTAPGGGALGGFNLAWDGMASL